jgi:hypothetical protein
MQNNKEKLWYFVSNFLKKKLRPFLVSNPINVCYVVGPNVNPLQNRETQHVNIFLQCMYQFFE